MNFLKGIDFKLIGLIIALVAVESFGQLFLEKATLQKNNKYPLIIFGSLLYLLIGYLYYLALNSKLPLAIVNIIWQTSTIIIITLISIFYFKQKITKKEIIGIVILLIGSLFFIPDELKILHGIAIGGKKGFAPPIKTKGQAKRLAKAIELKDY